MKSFSSSQPPNLFIHRRLLAVFLFPSSSDVETDSLFRTITFRLNRPLSSGLITFTGLSVFSRASDSVALAFPAALLLLLLRAEALLLLAATDVVSLLETGGGLAALLLLLLPGRSFVLSVEIVRWRTMGAGKLSFLSIASTVRWNRRKRAWARSKVEGRSIVFASSLTVYDRDVIECLSTLYKDRCHHKNKII